MCHLFVQKCFKLLMKHSSQADDKVNIYIENCLSCDQNQMHIILCSLSACYFLSKFLRVTFYVRVCWLQLQQVHMKLLCRYFDNPSQFIFNQSDTMDHKTSKQCSSAPPPSCSAHITADTDPHQTAALRLPQIYIRKH